MPRRENSWVAACALVAASTIGAGWAFAQPAPAKPAKAAPLPPAPSAAPSASAASAPPPKPKPDPATVLPARPPTLPNQPPQPVPWERHVDFGPDLAFVSQPASHDENGRAAKVHYNSTFGFAAHVNWLMLHNLQLSVYFLDSNHGLRFERGALGLPGQISANGSALTYSFGARFQPLLHFRENLRGWLSGGIGWARWDFPRMEVAELGICAPLTYTDKKYSKCYLIYERSNNMAVFPLGIGSAWDFVPHHLSLVVEFTAAIPAFQSGTAISSRYVVTADGQNVKLGGLPLIDVMLVETVGLSLVL